MKIRLADIAAQAGVSEATVSRVLNNKSGVTDETRDQVLKIAGQLGRDTSAVAGVKSPIIGIIAPDLENPIFPHMISRIDDELSALALSSIVVSRARTEEAEISALEKMVEAGASGVILLSGHHANITSSVGHYERLLARGIRLAYVNGRREGLSGSFISTDDAFAITSAVEHLNKLGHTKIGLAVGDENTYPVREKTRAFYTLMREQGIENPAISFTTFTHEGGFAAATELIRRGVTGVICGSDVMALGAIEGAVRMGLSVPEDLSIVGFDDIPWGRYTAPTLTTIRQAVPEIARAAVSAVVAPARPWRRAARTDIMIRPELVVRGSTAAVAGRLLNHE